MIIRDPDSRKATGAQIEYLEILLNDCGYDTRAQRNGFLSDRAGREIKFLDEITKAEASAMISELKDEQDERNDEFYGR